MAQTVAAAIDTGLAGWSIEDFSERADEPIYDGSLAMALVAAAAQAVHPGSRRLVLTARARKSLARPGRPRRDERLPFRSRGT